MCAELARKLEVSELELIEYFNYYRAAVTAAIALAVNYRSVEDSVLDKMAGEDETKNPETRTFVTLFVTAGGSRQLLGQLKAKMEGIGWKFIAGDCAMGRGLHAAGATEVELEGLILSIPQERN